MARKKFNIGEEIIDNDNENSIETTEETTEKTIEETAEEQEKKTKKSSSKTKKDKSKTQPTYINLDVTGRKEELRILAFNNKLSVTKYIQSLIDKDIKKNKEIIEKYKEI